MKDIKKGSLLKQLNYSLEFLFNDEFKINTILLMIYCFILFISLSLGTTITTNKEVRTINILSCDNILLIFLINYLNILFLYMCSFVCISIPMIIKILISIGISSNTTNISPHLYIFSTFPHGILELIVLYNVFSFSIRILYSYSSFIYEPNITNINI